MSQIKLRAASDTEQQNCQAWELWESGDVANFEYNYDQDVQFIVQSGEAIIHSPDNEPVEISPGCHVTIFKGVEGRWDIKQPIVNRYQYL